MTKLKNCIVLDGPEARDRARALVGVARRHTIILFVQPIVVGVVAAGVVLLLLAAVGLAR